MRYQNQPMGVLRFGLLGFKIHIQPGFWVIALLLVGSKHRSFAENISLVAIVFASILVHELGHAIAARRAGLDPIIQIHMFGGITRWIPLGPITRGRAIGIAMAGPAAGMLLAALSVVALLLLPHSAAARTMPQLHQALVTLGRVNGFWSVVNLLPIMPFDGGQILTQLLGPKRRVMAARVSLVVGCITATLLFRLGLPVAAVVFGVTAVMQFVIAMRAMHGNAAVDEVRLELLLTQARRALEQGETDSAEKTAETVIELSSVLERRRQAAEVFAWAALAQGQYQKARRVLDLLTCGPLDPLLQAAILEADGDAERAIACLRQARVVGDDRPQLAASLVRLLLAADRYGEAALTTIQILDHITEEEARRVMTACREGGRPVPAAELGMAMFSQSGDVNDIAWAIVSYSASGNRDAVGKALAVAIERHITAKQLLDSPAFETIAADGELRQQVDGMTGTVQPASV